MKMKRKYDGLKTIVTLFPVALPVAIAAQCVGARHHAKMKMKRKYDGLKTIVTLFPVPLPVAIAAQCVGARHQKVREQFDYWWFQLLLTGDVFVCDCCFCVTAHLDLYPLAYEWIEKTKEGVKMCRSHTARMCFECCASDAASRNSFTWFGENFKHKTK